MASKKQVSSSSSSSSGDSSSGSASSSSGPEETPPMKKTVPISAVNEMKKKMLDQVQAKKQVNDVFTAQTTSRESKSSQGGLDLQKRFEMKSQRLTMEHVSVESKYEERIKMVNQRIDRIQSEIDFDKSAAGKRSIINTEAKNSPKSKEDIQIGAQDIDLIKKEYEEKYKKPEPYQYVDERMTYVLHEDQTLRLGSPELTTLDRHNEGGQKTLSKVTLKSSIKSGALQESIRSQRISEVKIMKSISKSSRLEKHSQDESDLENNHWDPQMAPGVNEYQAIIRNQIEHVTELRKPKQRNHQQQETQRLLSPVEDYGIQTQMAAAEQEYEDDEASDIQENDDKMPDYYELIHEIVPEERSSQNSNMYSRKSPKSRFKPRKPALPPIISPKSSMLSAAKTVKLKHFKIPQNCHPLTALDLTLQRARQQLQLYELLKKINDEIERQEHLNEDSSDEEIQYNGYRPYEYLPFIRDNGLKVESAIMAQIVGNVTPGEYLKEGNRIMKDAFQFLDHIKQSDEILRTPRHGSSGRKSKQNSPDGDTQEESQLTKLERKFLKLDRRFNQVVDPEYQANLQNQVVQAEQDKVDKDEKIRKMEIEQKRLDQKIQKMEKKKLELVRGYNMGKDLDHQDQLKKSLRADIEVVAIKLNAQECDLKRLRADHEDLETLISQEKDHQERLITLAKDKYQLDLDNLDNYVSDRFSIKPLIKNGVIQQKMVNMLNTLKINNNAKTELLNLKHQENIDKQNAMDDLIVKLRENAKKAKQNAPENVVLKQLNAKLEKIIGQIGTPKPQVNMAKQVKIKSQFNEIKIKPKLKDEFNEMKIKTKLKDANYITPILSKR